MKLPGRISNNIYHEMLSQHGGGAWSHPVYRRPGGYVGGNLFFRTIKKLGKGLLGNVKKDVMKMGLDIGKNVIFKRQPLAKAVKGALRKRSRNLIGKTAQTFQATLDSALGGRPGAAKKKPRKKASKTKKSPGKMVSGARQQKGGGWARNKKLAVATPNNQKRIRRQRQQLQTINLV